MNLYPVWSIGNPGDFRVYITHAATTKHEVIGTNELTFHSYLHLVYLHLKNCEWCSVMGRIHRDYFAGAVTKKKYERGELFIVEGYG